MNIGIFTEAYKPTLNGVVVSIETFRKELEKRGHRYFIIAPASKQKGFKDESSNIIRLPSFVFPGHPEYPLAFPIFFSHTYSAIYAKPLDLVHCQHIFTVGRLGLKIAQKMQIPSVLTYHTLLPEYSHYIPAIGRFTKNKLISLSVNFANRCNLVITPSPSMKKLLQSWGVEKPIEVLPTGISLQNFQRRDSRLFKAKYNIFDEEKVVLYVGRLALEKKVDFLLRSFAKVLQKYKNVHLILVGSGSKENDFRNLCQNLGIKSKVTFTGLLEKEEAEKVFGSSDIFAFPSDTDTQGIVVTEAMAAGTVPVVVDALGPGDIVEEGITGFKTGLHETAFADKILKLLKDQKLWRKLSQNAKEEAKNYSIEKTAQKLEKIYVRVKNSPDSPQKIIVPLR